MSGGTGPRQGQDDDAMIFVYAAVLLGSIAVLAWFKLHREITIGVLALLRAQLWIASAWTDRYQQLAARMAAADPATVRIGQLYAACRVVSGIFRVSAAFLLAGLGVLCIVRASGERYTEKLDLDRLMKLQAPIFPSISAWLNRRFSLVEPDLKTGPRPADPALHLGEWITVHALNPDRTYDPLKARPALIAQLGQPWEGPEKTGPAARAMFAVFALHAARERDAALALLGVLSREVTDAPSPLATGPSPGPAGQGEGADRTQEHPADAAEKKGAPVSHQETISVDVDAGFARKVDRFLRSRGDRDNKLRPPVEPGPISSKPDVGPLVPLVFSEAAMREVDRAIGHSEITEPARVIAGQHAYTTTALMGLLMHARRRAGVLAPGQFAFLKLVDRPLWYALHSLGFPVSEQDDGPMPNPRIEALGARAHWEAERAVEAPLLTAQVEAAETAIHARLNHPSNAKRPVTEAK